MKQELLKGLSDEQIAKVKACKNHDELLSLAKEEGIELTDEQLTTVSGGGACSVSMGLPKMRCEQTCKRWQEVHLREVWLHMDG